MAKVKKAKHPHTEMHPTATCHAKGCEHPIKLNVVERAGDQNKVYTCYFHGLLENGKTRLSGMLIVDLLKARNRRLQAQ
jgi:hypothetical protein